MARDPAPARPAIIVALGLAGLALPGQLACERSQRRAAPPPPPAAAPGVPLRSGELQPALRLLSAGTAPLRRLRYHITPGAQAHLLRRFELSSLDRPAGDPPPAATASLEERNESEVDVAAVDQHGAWLRSEFTAGPLRGVTTEWVLGPLGQTGPVSLTSVSPGQPDPDPDELSAVTALHQPGFPDQPIGVGARWRITHQLHLGGLERTVVASFELLAVSGDTLEVGLELDSSAATQPFVRGGTPSTLSSLDGHESWRIVLSLAQPWPLSASGHGQEQVISTPRAGGPAFLEERHFTATTSRLPR